MVFVIMDEETKTNRLLLGVVFIAGMVASIGLFFSFPPVSYILVMVMFSGLILGLIHIEKQTNKRLRVVIYCSCVWLIILLAMSVAKVAKQYVVM